MMMLRALYYHIRFIDMTAEIRWFCDQNHYHEKSLRLWWRSTCHHHDADDSNNHDCDGLMVTMIFQVCGIVCIQSLWSQWREEKSIFRSLHELSMVRLEKKLQENTAKGTADPRHWVFDFYWANQPVLIKFQLPIVWWKWKQWKWSYTDDK